MPGYAWKFRNVSMHGRLLSSILVNLLSSVIPTTTSRTESTFYMLNSICTGSKRRFMTNRTNHVSRSVRLHMHLKMIGVVKVSVTNVTSIADYTSSASRTSFPFRPLVVAVVIGGFPSIALAAYAIHRRKCNITLTW
jgi:hypothetical protein